jgi:hypothetical protein
VLSAVGARTSTDAWAVGNFLGSGDDDGQVMLTEHWNGAAWSQVPTPNVVRFDEKLLAVSPAAPDDVWAVGSANRTSFATTDPLAAHWDGKSWNIVPTPAAGTGSAKAILAGVANLSAKDAWAVGRSHANRALIEHWDGTAWTIVPHPEPAILGGSSLLGSNLTAISARSARDIWAVGNFQTLNGTKVSSFTLTLHWDGTAWTIVPSPSPAVGSPINGVQQILNGVVEISPTDAWAVGTTIDTITGSFLADKPIALHWDGKSWTAVPLPALTGPAPLASVTANSGTEVWAAGRLGGNTLILHWNGKSWTQETTPNGPDGQTLLNGVSAVPGTASEVWAAGINLPTAGGYHTFVVRHPSADATTG